MKSKLRNLILLHLLVLANSLTTFAKPRIVDIDKELRNAKTVAFVTIESYTDTTVLFSMVDLFTVNKLQTARLKTFEKLLIGKELTGSLPDEHSSVLLVIDSNNFVRLFAKILADNAQLIFRSPIYTGSECVFYYGNNFSSDSLTKEESMLINSEEKPNLPEIIKQCSGKVIMSLTRFFFNYTYDNYETGSILVQGKEILFIPDIADSRAYKIKNKSDFKDLDRKRISAFGKLINYSNFDIKEFKVIN